MELGAGEDEVKLLISSKLANVRAGSETHIWFQSLVTDSNPGSQKLRATRP